MATVRTTTGSILGTFADTANAISGVMNTANNGVTILNDMVNNVKLKRREAHLVEMHTFRENLINDANLDTRKRSETIRAYIGNDETKQQEWNDFDQEIRAKFEAYDKKTREEDSAE